MEQYSSKLEELVDKWWGAIVIAIGNGKGRSALVGALSEAMTDAYDRGYAAGIEAGIEAEQQTGQWKEGE